MEDDRRGASNPYAPPSAALERLPPDQPTKMYVVYRYTISGLVFTYDGSSRPVEVAINKNDWGQAVLYSLLSLLLGWWGLPWGPIRTIRSVFVNLTGGQDVTAAVEKRRAQRLEDPAGTWTCPACRRPNSNRDSSCACGYQLL